MEEAFWTALDILRKEVGLSKAELARRAELDVSILAPKRRARTPLRLSTIAKLGSVLLEKGITRAQYALLVDLLMEMEN